VVSRVSSDKMASNYAENDTLALQQKIAQLESRSVTLSTVFRLYSQKRTGSSNPPWLIKQTGPTGPVLIFVVHCF